MQNGLCEEERKFILPKKYGDQLAESTIVFSFALFCVVRSRGEKKYLSTRLVIPKEGLYYYVIGSCDPDTTNAVLSGYSVTFNPYGHLPATLYGVYPFTKIVIWLYLFLSCYWFFRCWKYSQSLIIIHRIISLTLVSFIVSLMVFNFHLFTMNRLGSANSFLSFLSVFTASLAQGVFRILLFYISLGFLLIGDVMGRYGSVYNVSNMSSSLSVFLVIIYTLLNTSFKLNQETQNPVSISSTLIPALFCYVPILMQIRSDDFVRYFLLCDGYYQEAEREKRNNEAFLFPHSFAGYGACVCSCFCIKRVSADCRHGCFIRSFLEMAVDVRIKSENENRVTYGQWECMSLVLNVAIIVGIHKWGENRSSGLQKKTRTNMRAISSWQQMRTHNSMIQNRR